MRGGGFASAPSARSSSAITLMTKSLVQSLTSPFFLPHTGTEPVRAKEESRGAYHLQNHPVGSFRHKHKTIKCEVAGEGITIKYIHIS